MQYSRPADFEYLVLWNKPETTPLSNQSWLPAQNFDNPNAVIDYWKRRQDIAAPNFLLGGTPKMRNAMGVFPLKHCSHFS
jgi:hypothetical protein